MRRARRRQTALAATCLLALLGSGCTPDDPAPTPPPTSAPAPTPTENAQEREERLAYEAAEKNYREFRAEYNHLTAIGGTKTATKKMEQTAAGTYLSESLRFLRAYKNTGYKSAGLENIGYVRGSGYSQDALLLEACEDDSHVKTITDKGKIADNGDILVVSLEVRRIDQVWKIWAGSGRSVSSCDA